MRIHFKEDGHIYWEEENPHIPYISVTTLKAKYVQPFPRVYMSIYKAVEALCGGKNKKFQGFKDVIYTRKKFNGETDEQAALYYLNNNKTFPRTLILIEQSRILAEWDKKADDGKANGSNWHNNQEQKAYVQKRVFSGESNLIMSSYYDEHPNDRPRLSYDLPDGCYVELLMADHKRRVAGQCDRGFIETIDGIRYMDIDDWKTDKKLEFRNNYGKHFLYPLNDLEDCNVNGYGIQISMYAKMAEQYGFVIRNLTITHVREEIQTYKIPYWKKYIEDIFDIREKELKLAS